MSDDGARPTDDIQRARPQSRAVSARRARCRTSLAKQRASSERVPAETRTSTNTNTSTSTSMSTSTSTSTPQQQPVDKEFWGRRWSTKQTRWHQTEVHSDLTRFGPGVCFPRADVDADTNTASTSTSSSSSSSPASARRPRILVPLCGKTVDLIHLAQLGYTVIGIEYIEQGVRELFAEQAEWLGEPVVARLTPAIQRFESSKLPVVVLTADFFDPLLTPELIGGAVDHIWDRASFFAIPPVDRVRYVNKCHELLAPLKEEEEASTSSLAHHLLVTLCYPQWQKTGPPFAVTYDDLCATLQRALGGSNSDASSSSSSSSSSVHSVAQGDDEQPAIARAMRVPDVGSCEVIRSEDGDDGTDEYVVRVLDARRSSMGFVKRDDGSELSALEDRVFAIDRRRRRGACE